MRQIKYVIIDGFRVHLFDSSTEHKKYESLGKVTSAGFVHIDGDIVQTYGESISLKMGPAEDDSMLIRMLLRAGRTP